MNEPDGLSDGLAAALIQISAHAERIGGLDAREAGHFEDISFRLRTLASQFANDVADQQAIFASLNDLDTHVAALATRLAEAAETERDAGTGHYPAGASPRWWKQTGSEQEHALSRLRAWVEQIYRPGYGQLAAILPACWERHPACLYTLDWLSELWSLLYLAPGRDALTLAAQAEWHTRLLPAAANQMAIEAANCNHAPGRFDGIL